VVRIFGTGSRFAKASELEEKEARYKVVLEAIQAANKEQPVHAQQAPIDWEALPQWAAEKVAEEVRRYLDHASTRVVATEGTEPTSSSGEVAQRIRELYALQLPKTLLTFIEGGVGCGKLKTENVMQIIEKTIRDFDSNGPKWYEGNGDGLSGSFRRNGGGICSGDMVIRRELSPQGPLYKAYLITHGGMERYLGCDGSMAAVKGRARQFYVFSDVATRLRSVVEMGGVGRGGRLVPDKRHTREMGVASEL